MKRNQKELNEKGISSIGLAFFIVIFAALVVIAMPVIRRSIENSQKKTFIGDASAYITKVRNDYTTSDDLPEMEGETLVVPVSSLSLTNAKKKSAYGNNWVDEKSYVVITNIDPDGNARFSYSIALQDEAGFCIELTKEEDLDRELVKDGNCSIEVQQIEE